MASKLWQSTATGSLHPLVEAYTVGDDQVLDQHLLGHDITATKAHAHMLEKIGVLTSDEYQQLAVALDELLNRKTRTNWQKGSHWSKPQRPSFGDDATVHQNGT